MIKAIIIDDEISACEFLKQLIREKYYDVEIAGIAHTAKDGVMLITDKKPDLIFIDVLLLKDNELLFFDIAKIPLFDIIITTSISEFAFLSHKVSALHYILKPLKQKN